LIRTITSPYAILGNGELKKKLSIVANKISKSAEVKIASSKSEFKIVPYTKKTGKDLTELKK
jgi:ribosomal protein L18E